MTIKQFIKICKGEGWIVKYDSKSQYMELYKSSPEGEDYGFGIQGKNSKELIEDLRNYYEGFDPEEHAIGWYGANRGEPSSLRALLDDAEAIEEMIYSLYQKLTITIRR